MINIWLAIKNPFKCADFKNYVCYTKLIAKHKAFEVQVSKYADNFLEFNLNLNWRGEDHAGPSIEINLFGWTLCVKIYDTRHWDYENNCWQVYD